MWCVGVFCAMLVCVVVYGCFAVSLCWCVAVLV